MLRQGAASELGALTVVECPYLVRPLASRFSGSRVDDLLYREALIPGCLAE